MKLVIETSNRQASMLVESRDGIREIQMNAEQRQSSHLLPLTQQLLSDANCAPNEVEAFYVHTGPGSSTGLRMGVAMAQGWAAVYPEVKFYAVHLEAMAREVLNSWNPDKDQAYLLADAFAGQVFIQSFIKSSTGFEYDGLLQLKDRNALNDLKDDAAIIEDLGHLKGKQSWSENWVWFDGLFPHAKWVHQAGLKLEEPSDIHKMDVRYLKATSAELKWQEREGK